MDQTFTFNVLQLHELELQSLCKRLENKPAKLIKDLLKASSITPSEKTTLAAYALTFPEVQSAYYDEFGKPRFSPFAPGTLVLVTTSSLLFQGQMTQLTFKRLDETVYRVDWKRGNTIRTLEIVKVLRPRYISTSMGTRAKLVEGNWGGYFTVTFPGALVCAGFHNQAKDPQTVYKKFRPILFSDAV